MALRLGSISWILWELDLDSISIQRDACAGVLTLNASSPHLPGGPSARHLEAEVWAPPDSFPDPLYFPNASGFSNKPGCVEAYSTSVPARRPQCRYARHDRYMTVT